jgi:hypothetical protein
MMIAVFDAVKFRVRLFLPINCPDLDLVASRFRIAEQHQNWIRSRQ